MNKLGYEQKKKDGICYECGEPAIRAGRCKKHHDNLLKRNKGYREKQLKLGLCINCTQPVYKGERCEKHYQQSLQFHKELRKRRKDLGLCGSCLQPSYKSGLCLEHYNKLIQRNGDRQNINKNNWFQYLKENGLLKCSKCGYDKCFAAIDFHHIDPSTKESNIGSLFWLKMNEKRIEELKKCMPLCANCHREEHNGVSVV